MDECLTQEDVSAEADVNENHVTEIDLEGNIINFLLKLREKYNVSQKAAVFVTVFNYVGSRRIFRTCKFSCGRVSVRFKIR